MLIFGWEKNPGLRLSISSKLNLPTKKICSICFLRDLWLSVAWAPQPQCPPFLAESAPNSCKLSLKSFLMAAHHWCQLYHCHFHNYHANCYFSTWKDQNCWTRWKCRREKTNRERFEIVQILSNLADVEIFVFVLIFRNICICPNFVKLVAAANMKKCRARYGLDQQNLWCKPCRWELNFFLVLLF